MCSTNLKSNLILKNSGKPKLHLSEEECSKYANSLGPNKKYYANDNAPADPAGCVIKPDKSTVYFNKNQMDKAVIKSVEIINISSIVLKIKFRLTF